MTRVVMCGVSTRAAADSAARAGFAVSTVDAYGDRDQHRGVRARSMTRDVGVPYSAAAAARASRAIDGSVVAYTSNFENHPRAVSTLAAGRTLWGNRPAVLRRVRDPFVLADELRRRGFAVPAINGVGGHLKRTLDSQWLLKPRASGGGQGVRPWRPGQAVPRRSYLQERIDGVPGSIVFVAAGGRAVPLGMSRQIVGEAAFGATGYRYCGNILSVDDPQFGLNSALFRIASAMIDAAVQAFDLVGVNGIDFIARADTPYPIEINPRWSASMELVERALGVSVFGAHAAACTAGVSSLNDLRPHFNFCEAFGKAIVFARRDVTIGDTDSWLADSDVRDVPHASERIARGRPVCTVFASAATSAACHAALVERAAGIYAQLDRWQQEAA